MKIAHLPSSYFPDSLGGTEFFVRNLAVALSEAGHSNAVVWHRTQTTPLEEAGCIGLPAYNASTRSRLYCKSNGPSVTPPGFVEFLRSWRPDIVHFHAYTMGAGGDHMRAVVAEAIPTVVTYHTPAQSCARGTLMRYGQNQCDGKLNPILCAACTLHSHRVPPLLARGLARSPITSERCPVGLTMPSLLRSQTEAWHHFYRQADQVVACADFCREVLLKNCVDPARVDVIRQGIPGDTRRRHLKLPLRSPTSSNPLKIGFFARITHVKGADLLQKAGQILRSDGIPVQCQYAGPVEADQKKWVEKQLAANGNDKYMGVLRDSNLIAWLRALDLVVIPSRWLETGPLTLLEAWDQCIPVIGSDAGGIREFMDSNGQQGMTFATNDPHSLARKINGLFHNPPSNRTVIVRGMKDLARSYADVYQRVRYG